MLAIFHFNNFLKEFEKEGELMAFQLTYFQSGCECAGGNTVFSLKVQSSSPPDLCCNNWRK